MAHILYLSDGTTTVDFLDECGTSPWCHLADGGLLIKIPSKKQTWSGSNVWRQGRTLAKHSYENRDIVITLEIGGSSWDDILNERGTIYRLLDRARDSQLRGFGSSVYLRYQVDTTSNYVEFDVLDGELKLPKDLMSVEKLNWEKCGGDSVLKECQLTLICKPFARGNEAQLVNFVEVDNADDSARNNYVSWNASAVDGDVPGPLRITHNRNYVDGGIRFSKYWIGLRDSAVPANMIHVLEAEDADSYSGSPTQSGSNSSYSGNYTMQYSGISADTDHKLATWEIGNKSSPMDHAGRFRVLLVGLGIDANSLFSIRTQFELTPLRQYPWRTAGSSPGGITDLGIIELPPWALEDGQPSGYYDIVLMGRFPATAAFDVDALYLIPAEDYKLRIWDWRGYHQQQGMIVEDSGTRDQVYYKAATLYPVGIIDYYGLPIHATPGQDARLHFLWNNGVGFYDADYTAQISVYHTPYYLDIRGTN